MADSRPDRDPTVRPAEPPRPAAGPPQGQPQGGPHADLPRDHHPSDARSPEEYTETPGSHRKGRNGPATDVGA
jgi:hypothetical protein